MEKILLSEAIKSGVKPTMQRILKYGTLIVNKLKGDFKIEDQALTFLCPENVQKWSIVFTTKKGILSSNKKRFPVTNLRRVNLRSLLPMRDLSHECIKKMPDGGFELSYHALTEMPHILDVELDIENPLFIESVVDKKIQRETPSQVKSGYWLHAQLKFVDAFEKFFHNFKVEQMDFNVKVGVHQDIKTSIPSTFQRELELIVQWIEETERGKKRHISDEHLRMTRSMSLKRKKVKKLLEIIQDVFLPRTFKSFIDIKKDFYYHDCFRGQDFYNLPFFPTWPKFMTVVSRTDLNLEKPASSGILEFKRKDFINQIEKISPLPKKTKRSKRTKKNKTKT